MTGAVGRGTINCELDPANPDKCILSRFSYNYPLRFLVPKSYSKRAISVYGLSFGGGLVSGDQIQISLDVASNCCLTFLTQASTKVFKQRTPFGIKYLSKSETDGLGRVDERLDDATAAKQQDQHRPPDGSRQKKRNAVEDVTQVLDVGIGEGALLALLPEPVTCFAQASYGQTQTFRVAATGSLVLLDWFTSGRMSRGESWLFKRYRSENIVIVEGIGVVVKDAWVLEDERGKAGGHKQKTGGETTSYHERVDPYTCFANVIVWGPRTKKLCTHIHNSFDQLAVANPHRSTAIGHDASNSSFDRSLIWSVSPLQGGRNNSVTDGDGCEVGGCVLRAASLETSTMRQFLQSILGGISEEIGDNLFERQI